jgi:protein O-GlcNAc transferase
MSEFPNPIIEQSLQAALKHHGAGRLAEAETLYRRVLTANPNHITALHMLGVLAAQLRRFDAAADLIGRALKIRPDQPEALVNLGNIFLETNRRDDAVACFQRALALKLDLAEVHSNLGNVYKDRGQIEDAVACFRRALELKPDFRIARGNLLFALHNCPDVDPQALFEEHRLWNQFHGIPLMPAAPHYDNDPSPNRPPPPLRIGYLSPDFREHSVAYFIESLLAHHDRTQFEIFCYANLRHTDAGTARLRAYVPNWRDIIALDDTQVVNLIRQDRIDILVDLAGHSASNRLPVFARKPAPIQVTYLGYPDTTGLTAIDYRFTDAFADPPPPHPSDSLNVETLIRLPHCFLCFRPSAEAPAVGPLPAQAAGHITFGSFNALSKISPKTLSLWAEILTRVPASRLLLKSHGLADIQPRQRLLESFTSRGIAADRLILQPPTASTAAHLATYNQLDLALDSYPYHGTTTTCEALWMGVPVITLAGPIHAARVGVSLLSNVGLPELIARTPEQYVQLAVDLAGDLPRLADLRATLRPRMQSSPLTDAPAFTRHVEDAYRAMWQRWSTRPASA